MHFEWVPKKAASNRRKHCVSFEEASSKVARMELAEQGFRDSAPLLLTSSRYHSLPDKNGTKLTASNSSTSKPLSVRITLCKV